MDQEKLTQLLSTITVKDVIVLSLILIAGIILNKIITKSLEKTLPKSRLTPGFQSLVKYSAKVGLWVIVIIIIIGNIGINLSSLVALLGVLALGISLALQNALSNVAGGAQVLSSHPFGIGDYVDIGAYSGTVVEITMVYTKLLMPDGRKVCIPNSITSASSIINYNTYGTRRQDIVIGLSYDTPPKLAEKALKEVLSYSAAILKTPEPEVLLTEYGDSSVKYTLRFWTKPADYWPTRFLLLRKMSDVLDKHSISIPYPQMDIHLKDIPKMQ